MNAVHWLDLTVAGVLLIAVIAGAFTGFVKQLLRLATIIGSLYGALWLHPSAAHLLQGATHNAPPAVRRLIAFLVAFLLIYVVLTLAIFLVRKGIAALLPEPENRPDLAGLRWLNRLLGAAFGALLACVVLGPSIAALETIPDAKFREKLAGSKVRPVFLDAMRHVSAAIPERTKREFLEAFENVKREGLDAVGGLSAHGAREATTFLRGMSSKK